MQFSPVLIRRRKRGERHLAKAVIPIDHVVEAGRDFGQNNRARQIRGANGFRMQTRAIAIAGNLLQGDNRRTQGHTKCAEGRTEVSC